MDGAAFTASLSLPYPSAFTHWSGGGCESEKAGRRLVVDLAVTLLILVHKVVARDEEGGFLSRP